MYEGCFLQTKFLKILNVSVDQKTRLGICLKICSRACEMLRQAFETLAQALKHSTEILKHLAKLLKV